MVLPESTSGGTARYRAGVATSKRALLALIVAALAVLPPIAPRDGSPTDGVVAASSTSQSASGHRLELQLHERSAPAWPGSQPAHWAVTGPDAGIAPVDFLNAAPATAHGHAADLHILANQGRAPPQRAV